MRKIFIITDKQDPHLDEFIQKNFPENTIPIELIDHSVLFHGYEQFLPTFNSLSIETCLFRIPGLSENFVYFNDDFFLMRPVLPSDWYVENKVVATGNRRIVLFDNLLRWVKPKKNGHKPFGFKDSMLNAAQVLNVHSVYFHIEHTPYPLKKSVLEHYFTENEDKLIANISHKFRNKKQFNPQELFYLLMFKNKGCIGKSAKRLLYLKPVNRGGNYVDRKIRTFERNPEIVYCCIGSLDLANEQDRIRLFDWLKKVMNIQLDLP